MALSGVRSSCDSVARNSSLARLASSSFRRDSSRSDDDLVGTHVAQDADGADHGPVDVAQRRCVQRRGDDFPGRAPRVQPRIAGDAAGHDLAERGHEFPRFIDADEARQRLLDDLGRPKSQERVDRVVGLEDFALQVGDEDGIGRVLDQALGVGARFVELAHVAQDADDADDLALGSPEGGGVESGGDHLAGGAAGIEADVASDAAVDDLAQGDHQFVRFGQADEARQRLLQDLVLAESEQLGDGIVGLEDFALQVGDEDGVRGVLDQAFGVGAGLVELTHVAQDADDADHFTRRAPQSGSVEGRGDHRAGGAVGIEADVAGDAALDDLAKGDHQFARLVQADEA